MDDKQMFLAGYRDAVMSVVHANNQAVLSEGRLNDHERAGTALLMAAASLGFAAGLVAKTDPRLVNAPFDAQLDDVIGLLRETMIARKQGPDLNVVGGSDDG